MNTDPTMIQEVEDAGGMLRACIVGIAQMKTGELPRSHARLFYHQLDAGVRKCREYAERPDWVSARDTFLEFAETLADERDEARELIDDSAPPPAEQPPAASDDSPLVIFEFMAACRDAILQGRAALQRVRDRTQGTVGAREVLAGMERALMFCRAFIAEPMYAERRPELTTLADDLTAVRKEARRLL